MRSVSLSDIVTVRVRVVSMILAAALPTGFEAYARAQQPGGSAPAGPSGPSGATGASGSAAPGGPAAGGSSSALASALQSAMTQFFPGGVAPTPPGGTLGGGNVEFSSSKPITGNERDGFDFQKGGGNATVRGDPNAPFFLGNGGASSAPAIVPRAHSVRRGDTLWGICDHYFANPYQWPRIWSYNPQIQNPHWIYPGDQVTLKGGALGPASAVAARSLGVMREGGGVRRARTVTPDTVFLQTTGFVEDDAFAWGEITGSREEKMFLTNFDEAYVNIPKGHEVKVGQELTIFRPVESFSKGKLVTIQGTLRVDQWNERERIARARVLEAIDTIERGARVGPLVRRIEVVAPVPNEKDIEASVLTSVVPHAFYGQEQVLVIDRGADENLKPGNRLFVVRRGDGFHMTHPAGSTATRIAIEDPAPAVVEGVGKPESPSKLPTEVVAELRVISVFNRHSMVLVTSANREIEIKDRVIGRKGY
jgi:hypothetical protein